MRYECFLGYREVWVGILVASAVVGVPLMYIGRSVAVAEQNSSMPLKESWTNHFGMEFVHVNGGTFKMGSDTSRAQDVEQPVHRVRLTNEFWLQRMEVTQGQWRQVMGTEPWDGRKYTREGDRYAVTYVSWKDAVEFCKKLTNQAEGTYRLPTEAQWEYACRAGVRAAYSFGNDANQLGEYAWFYGNTAKVGDKYAHAVGQKKANRWQLHDMHGNVWEWCRDWFAEYPDGAVTDPRGPDKGSRRVLRGGSWCDIPVECRAAIRGRLSPERQYYMVGFRVLRVGRSQGNE